MAEDLESSIFSSLSTVEVLKRLPVWFGEDVEGLEVNLSDSTSGKRIRLPGRGKSCDHVDIVDVSNSTGAKDSGAIEWMCPVCGREYFHTDDIEVDMLLLSVLEELAEDDVEETHRAINLYLDGDWKGVSDDPKDRLPIVSKKRPRLTLGEAKAIFAAKEPVDLEEVIDLDSD